MSAKPDHQNKSKQLSKTVLVTGGNGFLASWIIVKLLQQNYHVHTTIQDITKEERIRATLISGGASKASVQDNLNIFQANLKSDEGWKEAVRGCTYVLHIASPFPPVQPKNDDDIIIPARDGALRVLQISLDAGVKRVVMTSSAAAIEYTSNDPQPSVITEEYWTDIKRTDITAYIRSKTIAERAAWDFIAKNPIELTTIAPATMLGPILGGHVSFSVYAVKQLLDGSMPAIPRLGFGFADVRDVADLHILAMTSPKAANERFLGGGSFLWLKDVAAILKKHLGKQGSHIPTRIMPNLAVRFLALFTPSLKSLINDLDREHHYSPEKSKRLLGWSMRPIEDTILDTAKSIIDSGILTKKE